MKNNIRPMATAITLLMLAGIFYGCNKANGAELTSGDATNATVHLKLLPKLNQLLIVPFTQLNVSHTNFYNAHELEVMAGASDSLNNYRNHTGYGLELGGTYWTTRYTGTGVRAGLDLTRPNANLFDWSQVDYSMRWPLWRFAPFGRAGLGKSFVDGSTYTKIEAGCEFRFSPTFGFEGAVGNVFGNTPASGLCGSAALTWAF